MRQPTRRITGGAAFLAAAALALASCNHDVDLRRDPAKTALGHRASFEAPMPESPRTSPPVVEIATVGGAAAPATVAFAATVRSLLGEALGVADEDVMVVVAGDAVTLSGTVRDETALARAIAAARAAGANEVHSRLVLLE